jgi:hypothetical protein
LARCSVNMAGLRTQVYAVTDGRGADIILDPLGTPSRCCYSRSKAGPLRPRARARPAPYAGSACMRCEINMLAQIRQGSHSALKHSVRRTHPPVSARIWRLAGSRSAPIGTPLSGYIRIDFSMLSPFRVGSRFGAETHRRLRDTRFPAARYHLTGADLSPAGSRQLRLTHRN